MSRTAIYKCQNAYQGVPHDQTKQYRADVVEPIIYEILAEYVGKLQGSEDMLLQIAEHNNKERKRKEHDLETARKELEKIKSNISVMEEHIPDAMTGAYPLTLEDLVRNIDVQKEKEKKQIEIVQEKETVLQNTAVTPKEWEDIEKKIPTWQEMFLFADTSTKRVLVNKVMERIDITKETVIIRFKISLEEFLPKSRITGNGVVSEQRL